MDAELVHSLTRTPYTLLYFYPKDDTPGCTREAQDFTRLRSEFSDLWVQILGVSRDSEASHAHFHEKAQLEIDLISDPTGAIHDVFHVIGEKKNYGKTFIGTIRSTFLLDQTWAILKEWRNVRATGHAERVLEDVKKYIQTI